MKILHTTDLHFNIQWFEWIAEQQNNFDIFCITGDFLESSKDETLLEQIEWVTKWMREFKKPLFVCSGNHDIEEFENEDWLNNISNVYGDNKIKTINGITFGCIPYIAPEFYEFDDCEVILYHLPPAKTKTATHNETNEDWGDKEFFRNINNATISPKIVLCGHIHYPIDTVDKIKNTTIYNTGADKNRDTPYHHIIEVEDGL